MPASNRPPLTLLGVLLSVAAVQAQTTVHPAFAFASLRPAGFNPRVSGLDLLADGTLVVSTWDGFGASKGSIFLIADARTGTPATLVAKPFATGLNEPLGVKVLDGEVHVITRDRLLRLPDADRNGVAEAPQAVASGWGALNADPRILEFAFGLPYKAGKFYVGLATAWPVGTAQARERGCILEVDAATGAHQPYACGFRTPNGMALGPEDELFATENQGNWVPASKLIHVKRGKFYGVRKTHPAAFPANQAETPPAVWLPHGDISISPTQPVWLKTGRFQGQLIAGDNNLGTLQRFFLEKVAGEWQGAVFRFTAGLEAGANRMVAGPDGTLYVGGIGTDQWGGWDWNDKWYGLQRLVPASGTAFEFLAVRSRSSTLLEVEFTEPAAAGAQTAANWSVRQWGYVPVEAYGEGKQPTENLTVRMVNLSPDGRKAALDIAGLKPKSVVHLRLANVASQAGGALRHGEAWYTLNAFGPGKDVEVEPVAARPLREQGPRGLRAIGPDRLRVATGGRWVLEVRDGTGALREILRGTGPSDVTLPARLPAGLYAVTARGQDARTLWLRRGSARE